MQQIFLYAIVPIIVVMLVGFISGKRGIFSATDAKKFNKIVLDYALPAALFVSIVSATRQELAHDLKLTIVSIVGIMLCFMAVYYVFRLFKGNTGAEAAVSALVGGSPTIGFLGFAVLEPIFGTSPSVALVVAIVGIAVNAIGIPVGLTLLNAALGKDKTLPDGMPNPNYGKHSGGWHSVVQALKQPVAWAPILAVVWVLVGIPWPAYLSPSFELIAKANASLAVFSAGITLSAIKITVNWQVVLATFFKMFVMPAVVLLLGLCLGMDALKLKMLVAACALPPAFTGIIIADEYDVSVADSTSTLTLSILLFIATCPLWIWITDLCTHTAGM